MAKPLELRPPVIADNPPASHRSWPVHSWARYIQPRPPLVDTIDWDRPLTFIVRGDAYPCATGSWTQLSIGLLNHGERGRTPAYLWVIRMAVCGDKDMAALTTFWAENLGALCRIEFGLPSFESSSFKSEKLLKIYAVRDLKLKFKRKSDARISMHTLFCRYCSRFTAAKVYIGHPIGCLLRWCLGVTRCFFAASLGCPHHPKWGVFTI